MTLQLNVRAQAPNPPDKICFDYDGAGNRIAQKPAWISIASPIDCQCNNPDAVIVRGRWWYINISDVRYVDINIGIIRRYVGIGSPVSFSIMDYRDIGEQTISTVEQVISNPVNDIEGVVFVLNQSTSNELVVKSAQEIKEETTNPVIELNIAPNPNEGQFRVLQNGLM